MNLLSVVQENDLQHLVILIVLSYCSWLRSSHSQQEDEGVDPTDGNLFIVSTFHLLVSFTNHKHLIAVK